MAQTAPGLMRLRLRGFFIGDHRKAPRTLMAEWQREHKDLKLGSGDAVACLSGSGHQLYLLRPPDEVENQGQLGKNYYQIDDAIVVHVDGTFHPWMLAEYCRRRGIDIALRRFSQYLSDARAERAAARAAHE